MAQNYHSKTSLSGAPGSPCIVPIIPLQTRYTLNGISNGNR